MLSYFQSTRIGRKWKVNISADVQFESNIGCFVIFASAAVFSCVGSIQLDAAWNVSHDMWHMAERVEGENK